MSDPFAESFDRYFSLGWHPLPLPYRAKAPVPTGYTGRDGIFPSYADVMAWSEEGPQNVAIRLPHGVIGIDVDAYGEKHGSETLRHLEEKLGVLPETVRSTSRDDGISGIYLYQVPPGLAWPGELGPGIDVVRFEHRYVVCHPSMHPATGDRYEWRGDRDLSRPEELPDLPPAWIEYFTGGNADRGDLKVREGGVAASSWLDDHGGLKPMCDYMARVLSESLSAIPERGSRHEWALTTINRIVWNAGEGHFGAWAAISGIWEVFGPEISSDRGEQEALAEFKRLVTGAVAIAVARFPVPMADECSLLALPQLHTRQVGQGTSISLELLTEPELDPFEQMVEIESARYRARLEAKWRIEKELHDRIVQGKLDDMTLAETVKRQHTQANIGISETPKPVGLEALLSADLGEAEFRVEGLWPKEGRVVFAASAKTGKSTVVTNLVRSLVDGNPFLGVFHVRPVTGSVVVIDNELDPRQIQRNYARMNVSNLSNVVILPMRGAVASFDITSPIGRCEWAKVLRDCNAEIVIFDCLRPLIDALGLSENTDAGRVLVAFDALLKDAGVAEGLVVHHMGHGTERSRGDTRIRDWPDAEWKLLRVADDKGNVEDEGDRYFSAFGRDVAVPESRIEWDSDTYDVKLVGGSRKETDNKALRNVIIGCLRRTGGDLTQNAIIDAMAEYHYSANKVRSTIKLLISEGIIEVSDGPNRSKLHNLTTKTDLGRLLE